MMVSYMGKETDKTIEVVHKWITNSLKIHNLSARQWALKAGVAPSTLQRFIAEKPWCMSASVISKLAEVVNTYPDFNPRHLASSVKRVPIMKIIKGKLELTGEEMNTASKVSDEAYILEVRWETMTQASINMGDKITVDPAIEPVKGDVVFVKYKNNFSIYEYRRSTLVARSHKPYDEIDVSLADVLGVVVEVTRTLR